MRKRTLGGAAIVLGLGLAVLFAARAWAALPVRSATFAWNKNGVLGGTFAFRDALTFPAVAKKLVQGLRVTVVMRGYVYPTAGGDPVALTAHTCRVGYDLWEDVYRVVVDNKKNAIALNMKGVYRLCTDMVDHPISDRATLKNKPSDYYLAVKVEVDPISEDALKKIQQWVTRPSGASGGIGPGDALFASFVGVFMKKVATAGHIIEFQTDPFPP